ncbi:hypothetical protein [Fulvivirga aurantia]|uniref:hypothetical protein n=1 Tax=Fulvivirga aurantia TaxID=2529383 RepID=UPI001CA40AF6|nr:hypothetical protein [Fulvivirga aurantia]
MIDFGLVVLIWMTQLIVYPGFGYYVKVDLNRWHKSYKQRITVIVAPLMFAQVGIIAYQILYQIHIFHIISAILVVLVWVNTFFFAVPLHNKITNDDVPISRASDLVKVNWYRTIMWTIIWLIGLYELSYKSML